jgi:hypothetical protein
MRSSSDDAGRAIAEIALDAVAVLAEMFPDDAELRAVQITLVVVDGEGVHVRNLAEEME